MEKDYILGRTEEDMKAHIKIIRKVGMEHLHGLIRINILEVGKTVSKMEKVNL